MTLPPKPADRLYTANMAEVLQNDCRLHRSTAEYVDSLCSTYSQEPVLPIYANILVPVSEWLGLGSPHSDENDANINVRAFRSGGLLGLRMAQKCGGTALTQAMGEVKPSPLLTIEKFKNTDHDTGIKLLNLADKEYGEIHSKSRELSELVTAWTKDLGLNDYDYLVRQGFGLMGHYACLGMVRLELEDVMKDADGYDWDEDFKNHIR